MEEHDYVIFTKGGQYCIPDGPRFSSVTVHDRVTGRDVYLEVIWGPRYGESLLRYRRGDHPRVWAPTKEISRMIREDDGAGLLALVEGKQSLPE